MSTSDRNFDGCEEECPTKVGGEGQQKAEILGIVLKP